MKPPRISFAAVLLASLLSSGAAQAQTEVRTEERWYGWQTTIGLGTAYGLAATGLLVDEYNEWFMGPAIGLYALTGPVVHLAHERWATAAGSFGLNLGIPLGGGLLGLGICALLDDCSGSYAGIGYVAAGVLLGTAGMLTANVLDVALLSFEEVEASSATAKRASGAGPTQYRPIFQFGARF